MAPPSLATYQAAADSIYAPQQAADDATALATDTNTKATLEAEKPQIATDYTSAIDKLTQSVTNQSGSIAQLYATRLGGNFSGLQGNAMAQVFASADEQQGIIEQTEANKLAQITTSEGEADTTYNADISSIASKYQGEEADEANSAYDTATNDYNTQEAETERAEIKASSSGGLTPGEQQTETDKYQVKQLSPDGAKGYTGPNGQTDLYQYAQGINGGASADVDDVLATIQQELNSGTTTDKGAANGITALQKQGLSSTQILQRLAKSNAYIFS